MLPIRAGNYRQKLYLYDVPETTVDSYGQTSLIGTLIVTFAGFVRPLRGDEQLNVRQLWPAATHKVWCNWLGSAIPAGSNNPLGLILPRMYLVVDANQSRLNISFADDSDTRHRIWELICEEKVNS